jgi:hypothetical protein
MTRAKISRSSVVTMADVGVPRMAQPYFTRSPLRSSCSPTLSAVWPPMEMMMPSGRSFLSTSTTNWYVTGRK